MTTPNQPECRHAIVKCIVCGDQAPKAPIKPPSHDKNTDVDRLDLEIGTAMAAHFAKQFNHGIDHKISTGEIDFTGIAKPIIQSALDQMREERDLARRQIRALFGSDELADLMKYVKNHTKLSERVECLEEALLLAKAHVRHDYARDFDRGICGEACDACALDEALSGRGAKEGEVK